MKINPVAVILAVGVVLGVSLGRLDAGALLALVGLLVPARVDA